MPKSNAACDAFEAKLNLLSNLQDYYLNFNDEDGNMRGDKYPFNYVRVLLHKIYGGIRQMNKEEAELKKLSLVFKTTINYIKSPGFSLESFFYQDNVYDSAERRILKNQDVSL